MGGSRLLLHIELGSPEHVRPTLALESAVGVSRGPGLFLCDAHMRLSRFSRILGGGEQRTG